jgi:hypothetical protein
MASIVSLEVVGGPSVQIPWRADMTAQDAVEAAYDQITVPQRLHTPYNFKGLNSATWF